MEGHPIRVAELASVSCQTAKDVNKSGKLQTLAVESATVGGSVKSGEDRRIDPVELVDHSGLRDSSNHPTDDGKNKTEDAEIQNPERNKKNKKLENKRKLESADILNEGENLNERSTKARKLQPKSATHPPISKLIVNSVKALKKEDGASTQAIRKYIKEHYDVDTTAPKHRYNYFLKTAVEKQILEQVSGVGATGRFKLREEKDLQTAKQKSGKNQVKMKPESKKVPIQKITRKRVQKDI